MYDLVVGVLGGGSGGGGSFCYEADSAALGE